MAINLGNKVSPDDIAAISNSRNPDTFSDGFGDDDSGGADMDYGEDDIFSTDDIFGGGGSSGDDIFGGSAGGGSAFDDPFGTSGGGGDPFGTSSSAFGGFGSSIGGDPFGNSFGSPLGSPMGGAQQQQVQQGPDVMDKLFSVSEEGLKNSWEIFVDIFKSVKCRNADDWAIYWKYMTYLGLGFAGGGTVLGLTGWLSGIRLLGFRGLPINMILCGCLSFGTALIGICISAFNILKITDDDSLASEDSLQPIEPMNNDSLWSNSDFGESEFSNFEDNNSNDGFDDDLFDDALSELDDNDGWENSHKESSDDAFSFDGDDESSSDEDDNLDFFSSIAKTSESKGIAEMADSVPENVPLITRRFLFETFKDFFMTNCEGFSEKKVIDSEDETFRTIETLAIKALASVANKEIDEIKSTLIKLEETKFCYVLHMTREKKLSNLPAIEKEIVAYFRDGTDDDSVNAVVDINGDTYKIVITKGTNDIITFGDCFKLPEVCDFYLNDKIMLPMIAGITDFGDPLLIDAKKYDTMLIAGKPRSGKSWYLNSILVSLCAFNTPEDVQLLVIDPKESYLFKSISMLPHTCGLHNHTHILDILSDLINKEGPRRKKLLLDNEVDDIWALRKKGIKLPILYIVIDEYMTIVNYLEKSSQELTGLMNTIISQLPSQGIRILFVPHRAQGVVDKTLRTLLSFTAAVRADNETVLETLGIKKWTRSLKDPGDTALKLSDSSKAYFLKGVALGLDDLDNTDFIKNMAKTFYKMGVDIPDMSSIGCGYNRNEEEIRAKLGEGENLARIQYNVRADLDKM